MATVVGTYQYYGTQLVMNVYEESTNYGGNYSGMRIQVYMYQPNNSKPWALDAVNSFSAGLGNGAGWGYSYGYDHRAGNGATTWLVNEVYNYGHNSLGQATVSFSASSSCSVIGSASTGTGYAGTTDFQYPPATPTAGVSRGGDGTSMTVTSSAPSSNATITDYNYRWSTDNSSWSGNVGMGTGRSAVFTGTSTQDYYFQTAAYSSEGWSGWSSSAFVQGVPTVPTSVVGTASPSVSGRITVSWTAPSDTNGGITNYYVYRNGTYVGQTGNANTSYIDDGLTKGTNYTYTVRAYNAIGYSALSSESTATQAPGVPYAATLNSVTPSTDTFGKVTLSWTAPTTAVGTIQNYYMYAVFNGVIEKTVTTASATTSGDITGLDVRKVYTFYVRARNQFSIDNGTPGEQSNTIDKKSPGAPTAPTSLTSSAPFFPPGTIDLSWTAPSDVGTEGGVITGYNIYLAGNPSPIKTIDGTGTTTTIEDLIPATSYTFQVRARNAIADIVGTFSDLSNSTTATAQGEPNAPTGLTIVSDPLVAGRLILTWEPPVGYNTGFRVYTGADVLVANIAVPRLEIDGLTPNTSYSYKVRARNPLTDLTGSPGGPASTTVSGVVGASSTQTVPSINVSNTTNNTFVGTYNLINTTATTVSYAKTSSNIAFASVPASGGSTANNTNTNLNGSYTVTVVGTQATSNTITYAKAGSDIAANTSTPSGTMYNNTNAIFNGNYEVLASPAPDPVAKTVSYSKVSSDITSRVASGPITNNSNAVYNGEHVVSAVTETTIKYPRTNPDISESDAFGTVYNKTNSDIFNGQFTLTDTPDHKTVEYSTGDLVYGENLVANPSMEFVWSATGNTLRTNLCTNPSFETNVTGWSGSSASIARSADTSYLGTHSGLVTPGSTSGSVSIPVTTVSGRVYTASAWVFAGDATSLRMIVDSPTTNGTTVSVLADTWTRLSVTFTANTTTTSIGIQTVGTTQPFYVDAVLVEQTTVLRDYFDGSTVDSLGWDYSWSGTANASTSVASAQVSTIRTNLMGNPSFGTNTSDWYAMGTSIARITSDAYVGTACLESTYTSTSGSTATSANPSNVNEGESVTFSVYVKDVDSSVQHRVNIEWYTGVDDYLGTVTGTATTISSSGWTRLSVSGTAPALTGYAIFNIVPVTAPAVGKKIRIDAALCEYGLAVFDYFDGSTGAAGDAYTVTWAGTAHASQSYANGVRPQYVAATWGVGSVLTPTFYQSKLESYSGSSSLCSILYGPDSGIAIYSIDVTASQTYTFSLWVKAPAGSEFTLELRELDADEETIDSATSSATITSGNWQRISVTKEFGVDAVYAEPILTRTSNNGQTIIYVDAAQLEASSSASTYFDGDSDANTSTWPVVYSWADQTHNSKSIREVGATLPSAGAELVLPYGEAARVNSKAQLQIQYRSGWIG